MRRVGEEEKGWLQGTRGREGKGRSGAELRINTKEMDRYKQIQRLINILIMGGLIFDPYYISNVSKVKQKENFDRNSSEYNNCKRARI